MNCKPGDLAVVCRNLRPDSPNRGKIVRCLEVVPNGTILPPQYRWSSGERIQLTGETWWHVDVDIVIMSEDLSRTMCAPYITDDRLRPLRPDEGEDETLTWAGKPNNVKEYCK